MSDHQNGDCRALVHVLAKCWMESDNYFEGKKNFKRFFFIKSHFSLEVHFRFFLLDPHPSISSLQISLQTSQQDGTNCIGKLISRAFQTSLSFYIYLFYKPSYELAKKVFNILILLLFPYQTSIMRLSHPLLALTSYLRLWHLFL